MIFLLSSFALGFSSSSFPPLSWFVEVQQQSSPIFDAAVSHYQSYGDDWTSLSIQQFFSMYEGREIELENTSFSLLVPQIWQLEMDLSKHFGVEKVPDGFHNQENFWAMLIRVVDATLYSKGELTVQSRPFCRALSLHPESSFQQVGYYCLAELVDLHTVNPITDSVNSIIQNSIDEIVLPQMRTCYYHFVIRTAWENQVWSPWANRSLGKLIHEGKGC